MEKTVSFKKALVAVILSIVLTATATLGAVILFLNSKEITKIATKLIEIDVLESKYFDGEIDYAVLDEAILSGYIKGIKDKYGFYKPPEDTSEVKDSFKGNAKGIGIMVTQHPDNKTMYIIRVNNESPAQRAGLMAGDEITEIDGKKVSELGYEKSYDSMQRETGKTVKLTILRGGKNLSITAVYGDFVSQTIYYHMIGEFGYVQITGFNTATIDQFKTALDDLQKKGAKGFLFDVRNNGGGTVESCSKMLDMLVPEGNIISVKYANGKTDVLHKSDKNEINLPMAVLVNKHSASASELFAANIRDYGKGKLFGQTTYGKGVMQRTYYLRDNSSLRVTVAKYYPKSNVNFDGVGLVPDTEVKLTEQQEKYFYMLTDSQDPVKMAAVKYLNDLVK